MKKVVIVLTDDFGELVLARLFAFKQAFECHMIMPEKMRDVFDLESVKKAVYKTSEEVSEFINQLKPDLVCLFSGYMFVPNGVFDWQAFVDIVDKIKAQKIPIVTSDPLMRLFDENEVINTEDDLQVQKVRGLLFAQSSILNEAYHIYDVPFCSEQVKTFYYYNDHRMYDNKHHIDKNIMTFIMAGEDLELQLSRYGVGFYNLLSQRLLGIHNEGNNHLIVIAPVQCLNSIEERLPKNISIEFVSNCKYSKFESIIAKSTAVFYWNVFSASIMLCRLYNKPVMFFDKGHMVRMFNDLYYHGIKYWYGGSEPIYVDIFSQIENNLNELLARSDDSMSSYLTESVACVTPEFLVSKISS